MTGFFIGAGQQNLRSGPHPEHAIEFIGAHIIDDPACLLHHDFIEDRQIARIIFGRIFHKQYHPHKSNFGVVNHIDAVFHHLDHREKHIRVAVPAEDPVDGIVRMAVVVEIGDLGIVVEQEENGDIGKLFFDSAAQFGRRFLVDTQHEDDEVEMA